MNPILFNEIFAKLCSGDLGRFKILFSFNSQEYLQAFKNKAEMYKTLINRAQEKKYKEIEDFLNIELDNYYKTLESK
jgi:hypothetical protein